MAKQTAQQYNADKSQQLVTKILDLMQKGTKPWVKPWVGTPYMNPFTGKPYRGCNPLYLTVDCLTYGYTTPLFMGASQARQLGWHIRKGTKMSFIKAGMVVKDPKDPDKTRFIGTKWTKTMSLDCFEEDPDAKVTIQEVKDKYCPNILAADERIDIAEMFIAAQDVQTQFIGNVACYAPGADKISMPPKESFTELARFYATWLHEHVHSTGHSSRCDREMTGSFGTKSYAFEELVAELGAALLCDQLGIRSDLEQHASYLDGWHSLLSADYQDYFKAIGLATKAAEYLSEKYEAQTNKLDVPTPSSCGLQKELALV
jgi:antirestriction protein ArdC